MPSWMTSFLVSSLICVALTLLVVGSVMAMVRDRKKGKSSCGGSCAHCAGCSGCAGASTSKGLDAGMTAEETTAERMTSRPVKITLRIDGMVCGMCASHINDCLRRTFPVQKVSSSYTRGETVLLCTQNVSDEAIREAIGRTGYTLVSMTREML